MDRRSPEERLQTWLAPVLAQLNAGKQISSEEVWQQLAMVITAHFGDLLQMAKPTEAMTLLQRCGDQQLKAKFLQDKNKEGTDPMKALEQFRKDLMSLEQPMAVPSLDSNGKEA